MTVESVLAHGLKTSVFGGQWNVEHGDNLALLDPDRIKSDLLANRPAAGVAHRFFFATDNQKLYYDTGAAWVEQSAAAVAHAATHSGGGADAVTLAQSQVTNLAADLAGKEPANANIQAHIASSANPHAVTKAQAGLGNVDNTSDAGKPVSTAAQTALNLKANDSAVPHLTGNESIGGVKTFTDMTKFGRGVQVASAAALNFSNEDGNYFNITGTAGITSISTRGATGTGAAKGILPLVMLKFDGAAAITNSGSLILPGSANIITHAGMVMTFVEESANNWRCIGITGKQPCFKVVKAANQSVAAGATAKILYDTPVYDTDNGWITGSIYRYTPPVAGYYHFIHHAYVSAFSDQKQIESTIRKNGTDAATAYFAMSAATILDVMVTSHLLAYMNGVTDYVEAWVRNGDNTSARNFCHSSGVVDFFSGAFLRY